ncbi:AMP-binding protein [Streptomyces sp. HNM0575]|uniref:AMP-binding protein n=1 Tax=Streptomyces sp. HNM0575 TaxID=2716338 RepID=UPI00145E882B|nr:AMP-binding protein [Streptomyces sp. HNM0575]NLU73999.1 AMP-binding protein [Streptomyces sp. HNM0575]
MPLVHRTTTDDPADRIGELLAMYGDSRTSVAGLLCDRHPATAVAYTVAGPADPEDANPEDPHAGLDLRPVTYGELAESSERFASALAALGVRPGDRVATLLGKSTELLTAVLGIWRLGAVHVPLFTAFAGPAVTMRLRHSAAAVVVCDPAQRPKLRPEPGGSAGPVPWRIIVTGTPEQTETDQAHPADPADPAHATDLRFDELLAAQQPGFPAARLGGGAPVVQIYTSGTTGSPKGVVVPAVALASFHAYQEFGLDVRPGDVFWNAADPGWGYGLYFGIIGSFCVGAPSVLQRGGFSPATTWAVLSRLGVTNFTAAPTVYRSLRTSDAAVPDGLRLRRASSAGEPLTPEVNQWARQALGVLVHDHYGTTETGMVINNHHHPAAYRPPRPGSMGHVMPGWTGAVLSGDGDEPAPPGVPGRIAFDLHRSPLAWFGGYEDDPGRTAEKFAGNGRWYLTGDVGSVDEDGYFRFQARDDDVIIMAGYRIGPFDVESVLVTHPAVAEAGVIAAPDAVRGEVLEAYVVLRDPAAASPALAEELRQQVKSGYAAHAYPRTVHFVQSLPKTPSGKIQRYALRERRRAELEAAGS